VVASGRTTPAQLSFNGPVEQGFREVADVALLSGGEGFQSDLELRADLEVRMSFLFVRRHPPITHMVPVKMPIQAPKVETPSGCSPDIH
jgi:hypothetical protein